MKKSSIRKSLPAKRVHKNKRKSKNKLWLKLAILAVAITALFLWLVFTESVKYHAAVVSLKKMVNFNQENKSQNIKFDFL